jgi:hypothetical protein
MTLVFFVLLYTIMLLAWGLVVLNAKEPSHDLDPA